MKHYLFLFFILLCYANTASANNKKIKTGLWYASFQLNETNNLPFIIDVVKNGKLQDFYIINGYERILLNQAKYAGDSIFISFPAFASELRIKIENKKHLTGRWYNHAKEGNYYLPFWSKLNEKPRYSDVSNSIDVSGKWEVIFDYQTLHPEKAIGTFEDGSYKCGYAGKRNNVVIGTFLTETGDYRFLEGATTADSLYLSTFDGSHAFLFTASLNRDTLWGKFYSGKHYNTNWYAVRNEKVKIANPDSLTFLINDNPIKFSLPNVNGTTYDFPNDDIKGKVTLIQLMGTWCPNCMDESNYLKELRAIYGDQLEIIAVTFETQKTLTTKISKVLEYKTNLGLDYTFLIGGDACKSCATELFPMLNRVMSFPTVIFIDKTGEIRKIHTGFNGPGTGVYYTEFVNATNSFVDALIKE
jgi:thiol-disulfide isomerase/thioredoxin